MSTLRTRRIDILKGMQGKLHMNMMYSHEIYIYIYI